VLGAAGDFSDLVKMSPYKLWSELFQSCHRFCLSHKFF
jgi:hypothetical protein